MADQAFADSCHQTNPCRSGATTCATSINSRCNAMKFPTKLFLNGDLCDASDRKTLRSPSATEERLAKLPARV